MTLPQQAATLGIFAAIAAVGLHYYSQMIFVVLFFVPLGAAALYMTLNGTFAGLYWALRISDAIARERESGTLELLSTSPYGAFSASWAICTGCQYYDQTFNGAGAQRVWFSRIFFLTLFLFSTAVSFSEPRGTGAHPLEGFFKAGALMAILALVFYIDDMHSTVIGSMVGVIVPLFARSRLDARVGAFFGFLALQLGAYGLVWLIGFELLPRIDANFAFNHLAGGLALPAEQLIVFFVVREGITRLLWWVNSLLLNGDVSDLRLLTKGGRLIC